MQRIINLSQEWLVRRPLRSGGFGTVYLAESRDGAPAVVKLVPKAPGAERELLFEDLDGIPNVVPVIDRGDCGDHLALVMPKADKSLREYLVEANGHLSVNDTVRVLVDVVEALVAIEGRIVHRDIKPDNILLLNGHWCLADFGISRYADAATAPDTRKYALSPPYAAPEQWRGERCSSATDVYATGVVAYEVLAGVPPFQGPEHHEYRRQHLEDRPTPIPGLSLRLQSSIDSCLYKSPEARPRPQTLLTQVDRGTHVASTSVRRLQEANVLSVQKQAEIARQQSVAKSAAQRLAGDNYFGRSRLLEWPPLPRRWRWREGGGGGSPKGDRSRPPPGSVHSTLLTSPRLACELWQPRPGSSARSVPRSPSDAPPGRSRPPRSCRRGRSDSTARRPGSR